MTGIPSVSVVIATYNYGRFLPGAIDSVLAQSHQNFELTVVDDGSLDNTPDVIRPYLSDPRIRYIRTENRGQPAADNTGIRASRAEWIAFLDADDLWLPTKLEKQLCLGNRHPEVGVVYTRRHNMDPDGFLLETKQPDLYRGRILEEIFLNNFVCFSSSMVRRDVFDRVGLFDERRHRTLDYDLWLRSARFYQFDFVDEPLVKYRVRLGSIGPRSDWQFESALAIMREFLEVHEGSTYLSKKLIHQAFAETYVHYGLGIRDSAEAGFPELSQGHCLPAGVWRCLGWTLRRDAS